MNISDRIALVRGKSSRASFASRLHIQENTLRNYEKGLSLPNASIIARICTEFNLNPTWLLLGKGEMFEESLYISANEASKTVGAGQPADIPPARPSAEGQSECSRCARLERNIDSLEDERRELNRENRQLLREIGELKAQIAFFEGMHKQSPHLVQNAHV